MNSKKVKLSVICIIISIFTLAVFHVPFLKYASANVEPGFNGIVILASLTGLLLVANYFASYLILWLGRIVGKVIIGLSFLCDAIMLYFINTFDVMVDDTMMGNVFNTDWGEATSYCSPMEFVYLALAGLLPAVILLIVKIDYGKPKRFFANIGVSLGIIATIGFGNMRNWPWIDSNSTVLGSLLMPWSYTVNSFRYWGQQADNNREEIMLEDATLEDDGQKTVLVLVIGESARRDHFSLYGYERDTNPLLQKRGDAITCYDAVSAGTYTTAGVKAILSPNDSDKLYEILPNYLYRSGAGVIWRTSNWGESPLHIGDGYCHINKLAERFGWDTVEYDELLVEGLPEAIEKCDRDKVLVVLHTNISHGPSYFKKYPERFETFSPVFRGVEMAKCKNPQELVNAYDNSILYTDYVLDKLISQLEEMKEWRSCMMYVSDHGESLGEGGLYMHGVPMAIAPRQQYEIPFIVWTSDNTAVKDIPLATQYHVFHSVLDFLGVESPVYDSGKDVFKKD